MTELVSPCCGKPLTMRGTSSGYAMEATTRWYECSACGKPCDPVPEASRPSEQDYLVADDIIWQWSVRLPSGKREWLAEILRAVRHTGAIASKDAKDEEKV